MVKKRRPSRRIENPTERVCRGCGVLKSIDKFQEQNATRDQDWVTYRRICKECEGAKALVRYYKQKELGKCSHCGQKTPTEGYTTCTPCRDKNKIAKDNSILTLRVIVLAAYGRKCAHCGDTRLECLEIDHIGGWGKDHKAETGERLSGYSLWKWIRDNNFPPSIRLLCGSCHSALSYFGILPRLSASGVTLVKEAPLTDASTGLLPCAPEVPTTALGLVN
jgi:hypothetical protein